MSFKKPCLATRTAAVAVKPHAQTSNPSNGSERRCMGISKLPQSVVVRVKQLISGHVIYCKVITYSEPSAS